MISKKSENAKLIDNVNYPQDIKEFTLDELVQLAGEVRNQTIESVSQTGGHLGAGLGVVELTVALHHVFDTPNDKIIWDVSHQVYPHKILTGRKDKMTTLRKGGGLSGFAKRSESKYDCFGAGHGGTSISAALGMAVSRDLSEDSDFNDVVAVIGDGSLTAGMAYEAMNNAGHLKSRMIVILNDNEMSIAPSNGAMRNYLCRLVSSKPYVTMRSFAKNILHKMPDPIESATKKAKQYAKDMIMGGNFFEELGFNYIGPVDGHDIKQLVPILQNIKNDRNLENPILLHVKTQKGKGFSSPVSCGEKYHAVAKFDVETKIQKKATPKNPTFTNIFAKTLIDIAKKDKNVVAITAAMPSGTGLNKFAEHFPERTFDVGMCEQHAVTFAAGLAADSDTKPYAAIYSTFLQRGYDQVVHDVALQNLPVRFMIDRAGFVGADGATHAGSFDLSYLINLPNMVVMAPSCEAEFINMIYTANSINDRPSAIRYPRGESSAVEAKREIEILEIGKGRVIKKGNKVALISIGTRLEECEKAAEQIKSDLNIDITIVDARFAKPIDKELVISIAHSHEVLITIEEGAIGGFGSHVSQILAEEGCFDGGLKFRSLFMTDQFLDHDTTYNQNEISGLNSSGIVAKIKSTL